jgi:DNA-binding response OmpR family regulator
LGVISFRIIMAKKILIVEDDKFLRELISQKLLKEGYDISEAVDGEKGLKAIKNEKPDLVLLDLILPGMDGFEVLTKVKEDTATAQVPIIILSNLGQKDDIERGLKLGAIDYLIKAHFTPGEIIEKIKSVIK